DRAFDAVSEAARIRPRRPGRERRGLRPGPGSLRKRHNVTTQKGEQLRGSSRVDYHAVSKRRHSPAGAILYPTEFALRTVLAVLLAGFLTSAAPVAVLAQEIAADPAPMQKIVIAPPRTELARIIKAGLQKAYYEADKTSRAYEQAQKLYF